MHTKLNLRVVDVATRRVVESRTFVAEDYVKTLDQLKVGNIALTVLLAVAAGLTVVFTSM